MFMLPNTDNPTRRYWERAPSFRDRPSHRRLNTSMALRLSDNRVGGEIGRRAMFLQSDMDGQLSTAARQVVEPVDIEQFDLIAVRQLDQPHEF